VSEFCLFHPSALDDFDSSLKARDTVLNDTRCRIRILILTRTRISKAHLEVVLVEATSLRRCPTSSSRCMP
jgi:hypothetical protein